MKKQLLLTLALFMATAWAFAQNVESRMTTFPNQAKYHSANSFQPKKKLAKFGENDSSDWYSILDMMSKSDIGLAGSLKYYVNFLHHDTTAKLVDQDGIIRYPYVLSVGHILDPTDDIIDLSDGNPKPENKLSRFNSYSLDSIIFRYLYVRNVETLKDTNGIEKPVVDTVFVSYWKGSQVRKSRFTDSTRYALPVGGWDTINRMPTNCYKIDTFLLSSGVNPDFDTTRVNNNGGFENSWGTKYAQLAAPKGMDFITDGNRADNLMAFAVTFKSGIPVVLSATSDTAVYIDQRDPATVTNKPRRMNYFGFGFESNSGTIGWTNTQFYNTPIFAYGFSSYNSFRGWQGYIVSQAFASGEDFLDCAFNLRIQGSVKAGIEDGNHIAITGLFPNPATKSTSIRFDLKSNSDVTVSVHNILGQEVMMKDLGNVAASIYEYNMDLSSLTPGVYTVSVKAGKKVQTERLMITE